MIATHTQCAEGGPLMSDRVNAFLTTGWKNSNISGCCTATPSMAVVTDMDGRRAHRSPKTLTSSCSCTVYPILEGVCADRHRKRNCSTMGIELSMELALRQLTLLQLAPKTLRPFRFLSRVVSFRSLPLATCGRKSADEKIYEIPG